MRFLYLTVLKQLSKILYKKWKYFYFIIFYSHYDKFNSRFSNEFDVFARNNPYLAIIMFLNLYIFVKLQSLI